MTETAKMYGGSLYDLAAEEGLETRILGELDEVQQLLKQNPDYLRLLSTPQHPQKGALRSAGTKPCAGRSTSMC